MRRLYAVPLGKTEEQIPLRTFGEASNTVPAGRPVAALITRTSADTNGVANHVDSGVSARRPISCMRARLRGVEVEKVRAAWPAVLKRVLWAFMLTLSLPVNVGSKKMGVRGADRVVKRARGVIGQIVFVGHSS